MVFRHNANIDNFYHSDHLGSAAWITDEYGLPVQYIMYAPYGEQLLNQHAGTYDERFTFTGKERDGETGYDYFGARYRGPKFLDYFLSVDPLADKYIYNSPYVYCDGNPIRFIDPNGKNPKDKIVGYALGTITSLLPGSSFVRDLYSPNSFSDYNTALTLADNVSFSIGAGMIAAGESGAGAGTIIAATGGAATLSVIASPEGAAITIGGVAVIAGSEALAMGGAILMANAVANKTNGYDRGGYKTSNQNSKFSNSRRMTPKEIEKHFGNKNWHQSHEKKNILNKFRKELKGSTNADLYVDKKNNQIYLKGNKSDAWVDTGEVLQ